jgi:outer membrane lipoprotein
MKKLLLLLIPPLIFLAGCAHVISDSSRSLVDRTITFKSLQENPESFIGKYTLLGGTIAAVKNTRAGTRLEVIQYNLDITGMPEVSKKSGGRFLAVTDAFLDPFIYKPGLKVSLVGKVTGKEVRSVDREMHTYPVIAIKEIYLRREESREEPYERMPTGLYPYWGPYGGF